MTNKEKLFEAVREVCPDVIDGRWCESCCVKKGSNLCEACKNNTSISTIRLEHLLRTAEARGKHRLRVYQDGFVEYDKDTEDGWIEWGDDCSVCCLDLTKSLSCQSDEVLNKLAGIIL